MDTTIILTTFRNSNMFSTCDRHVHVSSRLFDVTRESKHSFNAFVSAIHRAGPTMPRGTKRKMAGELPSFLDSAKCPICLDYAENAVETSCCGQVYCETCIEDMVGKNCPSCRKPGLRLTHSKFARKIISDLPIECPNSCEENVTRGTLERHKEICPLKEHQCPLEKCEFVGLKQHLIEHEANKHGNEVFTAMKRYSTDGNDKTFFCPMDNCSPKQGLTKEELKSHLIDYHANEKGDFQRKRKCPFDHCPEDQPTTKNHILQAHGKSKEIFNTIFHSDDGPIKILNAGGRWAAMAKNGKFYCGIEKGSFLPNEQRIPKAAECTVTNGLNCDCCMKLDVAMRNLPYGHFVNGAGNVTKPSICTHDVKDSEYFGQNQRSALCRHSTCGKTPKFSCQPANSDCTFQKPCQECVNLEFVFGLIKEGRKPLIDFDYYKKVWEKRAK